MNKKLLFSAAAMAGLAMVSTTALGQTSGCMPTNCPSADQPSTTGQGRGQVRQSPADQKTGTVQPDTTMKPADQAPPKSNPNRRGEEARRPSPLIRWALAEEEELGSNILHSAGFLGSSY